MTHPTLPSPGCWGLWRPVVLVPQRALQAQHRAALECALAHEYVHIERGDARAALAELAAGVAFWFHPVVHWIRAELARLCETSCDLAVVRRTGRARSYALALLDYARFDSTQPSNETSAAPVRQGAGDSTGALTLLHWSHSDSHLRRRIEMLTRHGNDRSLPRSLPRMAALALGAAWTAQLATAAVFLPAPEGQTAQESPDEQNIEQLLDELAVLAADLEAQHEDHADVAVAPEAPHAPHAPGVWINGSGGGEGQREVHEFLHEDGHGKTRVLTLGGDGPHVVFPEQLKSPFAKSYIWPHEPLARRAQLDGPRLGVSLEDVPPALAGHLGIDAESSLVVTSVEPGSAAARAGIREHDVLTSLRGGRAATLENLQAALRETGPGGRLDIELVRRGETRHVQAVIGAAPSPAGETSKSRQSLWRSAGGQGELPAPEGRVYEFTTPKGARGSIRWHVWPEAQREHAHEEEHEHEHPEDQEHARYRFEQKHYRQALEEAQQAMRQARTELHRHALLESDVDGHYQLLLPDGLDIEFPEIHIEELELPEALLHGHGISIDRENGNLIRIEVDESVQGNVRRKLEHGKRLLERAEATKRSSKSLGREAI